MFAKASRHLTVCTDQAANYNALKIIACLALFSFPFILPELVFAADRWNPDPLPMKGLTYIGATILALVSLLIITDHYLDPGVRLSITGTVSLNKNMIAKRESAPGWFWVMNLTFVVLSFAIIFGGFVLERRVGPFTGRPVEGELPRLVEGIPFYTYLVLHTLMAAIWMPMMICIKQALGIILRGELDSSTIVTRSGARVSLPPEMLGDMSQLKSFLETYQQHPDYEELCSRAIEQSVQARRK